MRRRPSRVDVLRVVRTALAKLTRPVITPGQGRAIRNGPQRPAGLGRPPLQDPDGGRRGD